MFKIFLEALDLVKFDEEVGFREFSRHFGQKLIALIRLKLELLPHSKSLSSSSMNRHSNLSFVVSTIGRSLRNLVRFPIMPIFPP